jgi:hypothetical protein
MRLCDYITVIDGSEEIKIKNFGNGKTLYKGEKRYAPAFIAIVIAVYTENGKIIIEISD